MIRRIVLTAVISSVAFGTAGTALASPHDDGRKGFCIGTTNDPNSPNRDGICIELFPGSGQPQP